jgi:lipopolysaccharide transport system ATP-binding protein
MSSVIKVENLSKQYRLGTVGTGTLSHDLNRWWHRVRGKEDPYLKIGEANDRATKGNSDYVWALRDINFEVEPGEVLGIIGKNGAGKSTLLKILSRVTKPTTGSIKVKGRIASLLEVGTGFHPELTGRENIFLNGAILGMTKAEIRKKFDEIVDFAGVDRYIDTPVKRYSSGMYVRLAFAVAAHLEPEILIVDEVLAVGDAEFQKKALGKMQDVSRGEGRTVLFVSHNMGSIENLCTTAIYMEKGGIKNIGRVNDIIGYYFNEYEELSNQKLVERKDRQGINQVIFTDIQFIDTENGHQLMSGKKVKLRLFYKLLTKNKLIKSCRFSVAIFRGNTIFFVLSSDLVHKKHIEIHNDGYIDFEIESLPLSRGEYYLTVFLESYDGIEDWVDGAAKFEVEDGDFYGTGKNYPKGWDGKTVLVRHKLVISS